MDGRARVLSVAPDGRLELAEIVHETFVSIVTALPWSPPQSATAAPTPFAEYFEPISVPA